jgi:hypothetical protein
MSKTIEQYADDIMQMIDADIEAGLVSRYVRTYSDLHDFVDANGYTLDAEVPWHAENLTTINAVQAEVDARLRARTSGGPGCCSGHRRDRNGVPGRCGGPTVHGRVLCEECRPKSTAVVTTMTTFCHCPTPSLDKSNVCRKCGTQWAE